MTKEEVENYRLSYREWGTKFRLAPQEAIALFKTKEDAEDFGRKKIRPDPFAWDIVYSTLGIRNTHKDEK